MGHRIPSHFIANLHRTFTKKNCSPLFFRRSYIVRRKPIELNITGVIHSHSFVLPFSTEVEQECSRGYLQLSALIKDEIAINESFQSDSNKEIYGNRTCLYAGTQSEHDPVLTSLIQSNTIEEVFDLVKNYHSDEKIVTQAVVTLWDLCCFDSFPLSSLSVSENLKNFIQVRHIHLLT